MRSFVALAMLGTALPAFAGDGYVTHVESKVQVTVQNNLDSSICYLYISPTTDDQWGPDQLGSRTLIPGESDQYEIAKGDWDVKAEDCQNTKLWESRGISIYDHGTLNIGDGHVRQIDLTVVNTSDTKTVCYLYISPSDKSEWGADVLEDRTLSPSETDHYQMATGSWDFKAEDCDHNSLVVLTNIAIDDHSVLTLTD